MRTKSRRLSETAWYAMGRMTVAQVAWDMFIQEQTAKNHFTRLFRQFGVANREEFQWLMAGFPIRHDDLEAA